MKGISHLQSQPYAPPEDNKAADTLTHATQFFFYLSNCHIAPGAK